MKSLVTGVKGQLGYDIVRELKKRGYTDILAVDYEAMDITNKEQVDKIINEYNPDVVFHCAAYTAVDKAEENTETCMKVNVEGTKNIAEAAKKVGSKLIYLSTDYVFDGTKDGIYEVSDKTNPKSIYGLSKYKGELEALKNDKTYVVRISWVFGINGNNFVKTMLKLAETKNEINVVNDQIGSPTYTVDLARLLVDMAETNKYGLYFATNEGYMSWYDFAKLIYEVMGIEMKVNSQSTEEYLSTKTNTIAERPMNSKLSKQKLIDNGFALLPTVREALEKYREELIENNVLVKKK